VICIKIDRLLDLASRHEVDAYYIGGVGACMICMIWLTLKRRPDSVVHGRIRITSCRVVLDTIEGMKVMK
jgi:hypothetical protein